MPDIELVIKLPEDKYNTIVGLYDTFPAKMKEWGLEAIKNGIRLSKGHWIRFVENGLHKIKCSKCGYIEDEYKMHIRNYCPNCGIMEDEE